MTVGQLYRKLQYKVQKIVRNGCATPFFRGQSNSSWNLTPGLGREVTYDPNVEREMYTEFRKRGAHLISDAKTDWDILYLMQHHGVPTRLLDWSESFANALYFALPEEVSIDETRTGRLYILDTSHLNYAETATNSIVTLNAKFPAGYEHYFLNESHDEVYPGFPRAVAVGGLSTSSRIYAQRGVFTIHGDPISPLEDICPQAIQYIDIPSDAATIRRIDMFLWLLGINRFSVYQDLDSLGTHIKDTNMF